MGLGSLGFLFTGESKEFYTVVGCSLSEVRWRIRIWIIDVEVCLVT